MSVLCVVWYCTCLWSRMTALCVVQQYWAGDPDKYAFVGVSQLAQAFKDSGISTDSNAKGDDVEAGHKLNRHKAKPNGEGKHQQLGNGSNGSHGGAEHTKYAKHAKHTGANGVAEQQSEDLVDALDLDPLVHSK